jgi:hypothetical protein
MNAGTLGTQKTFTDQSGFKIILQTGPTANVVVNQLVDNYVKANCTKQPGAGNGFVAWNPPADGKTYLGVIFDPETNDGYYVTSDDAQYIQSLQGLNSY